MDQIGIDFELRLGRVEYAWLQDALCDQDAVKRVAATGSASFSAAASPAMETSISLTPPRTTRSS